MNFVYDLPTIVFGPIFILLVVALSIGGLMLVHRSASQGAFGGALTIGFAYLFGGVNRIQHAVMVGILAATVATMFLLVIEINLPFRGDVGVSDHIWQTQQQLFGP